MDFVKKKERIMHVYDKCKKLAQRKYSEGNYEECLAVVSVSAALMYSCNIIYTDEISENLIKDVAKNYIGNSNIESLEKKTVVFTMNLDLMLEG